ncbi:hypothetical protein QUC31_002122 [Theobroma cacao]
MSRETRLDTLPLLSEASHGEEEINEGSCWRKALDLEEAKNQIYFSLPMIITSVFYYSITLVSVMFAGHLGDLELAGATLANSWATVTGFALMQYASNFDEVFNLVFCFECVSKCNVFQNKSRFK